eukprot:CAMPEP_0113883464 /NCGR_PEP_ID=MMETSP0780_2-20120614/9616_1 /TAXON_ID=652834 /ORGANISM="Palpitomonas bilix" /LENGTH=405 /DNA_ID=CAMNT_0000870775 /DNA_START=194 /DNA_END=1411 /DNA_ORIENTATION=- /assembly_acc=CAM_ASM_000599
MLKQLQVLNKWHGMSTTCSSFSSCGRYLISSSLDTTAVVYTRDKNGDWDRIHTIPHQGWVGGCAFSPLEGETFFLTACDYGYLSLGRITSRSRAEGDWCGEVPPVQVEVRDELIEVDADTSDFLTVAITPDGQQVAASLREGAVHIWAIQRRGKSKYDDVGEGERAEGERESWPEFEHLQVCESAHLNCMSGVAFSPSSRWMATSLPSSQPDTAQNIALWRWDDDGAGEKSIGTWVQEETIERGCATGQLVFGSIEKGRCDSVWLAAASEKGVVEVWAGREKGEKLIISTFQTLQCHDDGALVAAVALLPLSKGGTLLFTGGGLEGYVKVWMSQRSGGGDNPLPFVHLQTVVAGKITGIASLSLSKSGHLLAATPLSSLVLWECDEDYAVPVQVHDNRGSHQREM